MQCHPIIPDRRAVALAGRRGGLGRCAPQRPKLPSAARNSVAWLSQKLLRTVYLVNS